jgi:chemotaxis-related protein WspB
MLLLLFQAGACRYGIDACDVVEVIPPVACKSLPNAPSFVAGLVNYRGAVVPVVDLTCLLGGQPSQRRLSTRIILARYGGAGEHVLGLLAEGVTETVSCREQDSQPSGIEVEGSPFLGSVLSDREGMIQRIILREVLPPALRESLFRREADP